MAVAISLAALELIKQIKFRQMPQRDYEQFMKGKVREKYANPYMACASRCIATVLEHVAGSDRVLFVFDRQDLHKSAIESLTDVVFKWMDLDPRLDNIVLAARPSRNSKLSKNVCLDPADYLAFQLRELCLDANSFKSKSWNVHTWDQAASKARKSLPSRTPLRCQELPLHPDRGKVTLILWKFKTGEPRALWQPYILSLVVESSAMKRFADIADRFARLPKRTERCIHEEGDLRARPLGAAWSAGANGAG